jgi:hypothetical protein
MSAALRFAERSGSQIAHEINRDIQDSEDFMEAINLVCIELTAAFDGTHGKVTRAVAAGMATNLAHVIACGLGSVEGYKEPAWLSATKESQE